MNTFAIVEKIQSLAAQFADLGGMDSERAEAWVVYEHLVEAVEMAPDHASACRIAESIVANFGY